EQRGEEEAETGGLAEIKAEAKDWREVKRGVEVDVVGDLHSNYIALRENLKTLGVAQEIADGKFEWTGGNRKVILIGDILGDRWDGGNKILLAVEDLELQAKAAGGELMRVAGNHDDFEMSYLMGRETAGGGDPVQNCYKEDQGFGLLELREFGSDSLKSRDFEKEPFKYYAEAPPGSGRYEHDPIWDQMSTERRLILDNMKNSEKGKKILEAICRFKLVEFCDDNLFIHTDPTADIAQSLLALKAKGMDPRAAADYLNDYFQQNLRAVLLGGKEPDAQFDKVREIFLKTGNRANFTAASRASDYKNYHLKERHVPGPEVDAAILKYRPQWEAEEREITDALKEWGINAIIHGHSSGNFVEKFDPALPIITADMGAFQYKKDTAVARSVVRIRTDGTIDRGTTVDLGGDKQMIEVRSR
ncbi:MAG: metallophosphoesterase, partial [Candidatus Doudnabacteria bacterium]|nr:metallophosphoesterase [Candidatus Doudnabacteria bacterium]